MKTQENIYRIVYDNGNEILLSAVTLDIDKNNLWVTKKCSWCSNTYLYNLSMEHIDIIRLVRRNNNEPTVSCYTYLRRKTDD